MNTLCAVPVAALNSSIVVCPSLRMPPIYAPIDGTAGGLETSGVLPPLELPPHARMHNAVAIDAKAEERMRLAFITALPGEGAAVSSDGHFVWRCA